MKILVRDFMSTSVSTVPIRTSLIEAAQHLLDSSISCLLVVDKKPVGFITDRDFTRMVSRLDNGERLVNLGELISSDIIYISQSSETQDALNLMTSNRLRRLLVLDEANEVCGIITQSDVLRAHNYSVEAQKAELERRVVERTVDLENAISKLEQLTLVDPLLNIGNRRAMDLALQGVLNRALRYNRPYCILLIDIDNFKTYNDHYGHQKGDEILIKVASKISKTIRNTDSVYRYGGEEFLVILPETETAGGSIAAEHIRLAIAELKIEHILSSYGIVTISIGVAEELLGSPNQTHTVKLADSALYRAKDNGRNRVEKIDRSAGNLDDEYRKAG